MPAPESQAGLLETLIPGDGAVIMPADGNLLIAEAAVVTEAMSGTPGRITVRTASGNLSSFNGDGMIVHEGGPDWRWHLSVPSPGSDQYGETGIRLSEVLARISRLREAERVLRAVLGTADAVAARSRP